MSKAIVEDTQKRLLDVAGQVFAEKGFKGATVREICQRAGANIAAINYYFRDKEGLYRAALEHAFQCRMDQLPLPNWPPGTPAAVRLRDLIRIVFHRMVDDTEMPWQMQFLLHELSRPTEAGRELVRGFIRPIYGLLWSILRELLPPGTSEEDMHLISFSIVGQAFYHRLARHVLPVLIGEEEYSRYHADRLADHITDFSLAALGYHPPLPVREEEQ